MSQSQYESRPRHPLRDRRPWLQLAPFLLPFLLLAGMTIEQAELRPPPRHVLHDALRHAELIGIDSHGFSYLQQMLGSSYAIFALDTRGQERWSHSPYDLFGKEWMPIFTRLQEQADGGIVLRSKEGLLFCVNRDGSLRWKYNHYEELSYGEDSQAGAAVRLLTPPEQVPPFTVWHDRFDSLFALDYAGNLLWTTEAWPPAGNKYGDKDNWTDGKLLVTVRRPQTMLDEGTGDYILRQVLRNGNTLDLARLDLQGMHSPPVAIGDRVYSLESSSGRGLQYFREARLHRGYNVIDYRAWDVLPQGAGLVLREIERGLSCYDAAGELSWHIPERGQTGRLACAGNGRTYYQTAGSIVRGPLTHWPPGLAVQEMLRTQLRISRSGAGATLRAISPGGSVEWETWLDVDPFQGSLRLAGPWLATQSGADLLLYEIGLGDD